MTFSSIDWFPRKEKVKRNNYLGAYPYTSWDTKKNSKISAQEQINCILSSFFSSFKDEIELKFSINNLIHDAELLISDATFDAHFQMATQPDVMYMPHPSHVQVGLSIWISWAKMQARLLIKMAQHVCWICNIDQVLFTPLMQPRWTTCQGV